tara:strand:- start:103 stop:993 length:891 start_codon:yes stop_codon:yes gene_type:complete
MEIIVKINDGPSATSYKDGDIVQAFTQDEIYYHHAQNKCNIKNFGFTTDGMRSPEPLLIKYLEKTKTFKFERLNSNEVRRTNLLTNQEDILTTTPNENGEYIDVYQYVTRRLKNKNHLIFRENGLEYWYAKERANIDVNALWNDIETHTSSLQSQHTKFSLSSSEKRKFLVMNCCTHTCENDHYDHTCLDCSCHCDLSECSKEVVQEKTSSVVNRIVTDYFIPDPEDEDQTPQPIWDVEILHKRKHQVPYWDLASSLSLNVDDVRNASVEVDSRKEPQQRPSVEAITINKIDAGII